MAFKVTLSPNAGTSIVKALKGGAEITIRREAARTAELAVQEGQRLARERLYVDRPANRRRAGSRRYVSGFSAEVLGDTFPFRVKLKNASKVAKLIENGSPAHVIPRPAKGRLGAPAPWKPAGSGSKGGIKHEDAYGGTGKGDWVDGDVSHPGTAAYKIMEDALRSAFRKRGARLTK